MDHNKKIRIILTDDHTLVRDGLKLLLEEDEVITVVGEAASGQDTLEILAATPADIVLLDINMPLMDGYETTKLITAQYPDTKVVALTMINSELAVQKIFENGASGYVLKTAGKVELNSAIKLVNSGTPFICSDLAVRMLHKGSTTTPEEQAPFHNDGISRILSKRELEILGLIAEGFTNAEIAEKLFTSKRTVETHRQNIIEKTGAKNTANLVKYAIRNGYISIDL